MVVVTLAVAAVATLVGVPLGLAVGSAVWRLVADGAGVAGDALFASGRLAFASLLVLPVALAVAAGPAWQAARLRIGEHLRVE